MNKRITCSWGTTLSMIRFRRRQSLLVNTKSQDVRRALTKSQKYWLCSLGLHGSNGEVDHATAIAEGWIFDANLDCLRKTLICDVRCVSHHRSLLGWQKDSLWPGTNQRWFIEGTCVPVIKRIFFCLANPEGNPNFKWFLTILLHWIYQPKLLDHEHTTICPHHVWSDDWNYFVEG